MPKPPKNEDQIDEDENLRRMLKTPPKPRKPNAAKPKKSTAKKPD